MSKCVSPLTVPEYQNEMKIHPWAYFSYYFGKSRGLFFCYIHVGSVLNCIRFRKDVAYLFSKYIANVSLNNSHILSWPGFLIVGSPTQSTYLMEQVGLHFLPCKYMSPLCNHLEFLRGMQIRDGIDIIRFFLKVFYHVYC